MDHQGAARAAQGLAGRAGAGHDLGRADRPKHLWTIPEYMDRALAEHEKAQAYPEAAEQARAEFAELHSGTG